MTDDADSVRMLNTYDEWGLPGTDDPGGVGARPGPSSTPNFSAKPPRIDWPSFSNGALSKPWKRAAERLGSPGRSVSGALAGGSDNFVAPRAREPNMTDQTTTKAPTKELSKRDRLIQLLKRKNGASID